MILVLAELLGVFMKIAILLFLLVPTTGAYAATTDSLTFTQSACKAFISRLKSTPRVTFGFAKVPKDWSRPHGQKLPVFWWKRAGTQSSVPPLAFLHGGVAGNSWGILDRWQSVFNDYPGDIVTFDHRGEGCSKTLPSNLAPSIYKNLGVRSVVRDMEYLRKNVFKYSKWRIVGHSRGSALAHYYLEMAPEALESVHAMGFALAPTYLQKFYAVFRAQGFYDTAKAYLIKYPGDDKLVKKIKSFITKDTCWLALDDRKVCGPDVLDVFANYLGRVSSWEDLHKKLISMVDFKTTYATIGARLSSDLYGHFNYIIATNGQEFGSPDSDLTVILNNKPVTTEAFLSEIRYIGKAIMPSVNIPWHSAVDPVDFNKIRNFLREHPETKYYLYSGALDPVAPPMSFKWEVGFLGSLVKFVNLPDSAHDGWFDPILLKQIVRN
jgi:pimeloyl-ACP methyl ester carboxylesterase